MYNGLSTAQGISPDHQARAKTQKWSVAIINYPHDEPTPYFDSTTWSYAHATLHTHLVTTHTATSTLSESHSGNHKTSTTTRTVSHPTDNIELREHSALKSTNFFNIPHTLTGGITQVPVKYLKVVYVRLKETKRTQYSIITLQILLRSLVISVCGFILLCSYIPIEKYITIDRAVHAKYIKDTKHTITQPDHATFLSWDHYGLYIPFLLLTQLQGRT